MDHACGGASLFLFSEGDKPRLLHAELTHGFGEGGNFAFLGFCICQGSADLNQTRGFQNQRITDHEIHFLPLAALADEGAGYCAGSSCGNFAT